jgi:hypothetical protein
VELSNEEFKGNFSPIIEKVCNIHESNIGLLKDFVSQGVTFYSKYKTVLMPTAILASALIPVSTIALLSPNNTKNVTMVPMSYEVVIENPVSNIENPVSKTDVVNTAPVTMEKPNHDVSTKDTQDIEIDFDKRELKPQIFQSIISAANEVDFDPALLLTMAWFESKMDDKIDNKKSSAVGLFQFTSETWVETIYKYGRKHNLDRFVDVIYKDKKGHYHIKNERNKNVLLALRNNPKISAIMAAEMMKTNKNLVEDKIGNKVKGKDAYLIHVLGPGGASKFFESLHKRPNIPSSLLFPLEVKKNPHLFVEKKEIGNKKTKRIRTISESHEFVADMISKQMDRYKNMLKIGEDKLIQKISSSKETEDETVSLVAHKI